MKLIYATFLGLAIALSAGSQSYAADAETAAAKEPFKLIHTDQLAKMIEAKPGSVHIYDVNTADLRSKEGLIPGATPVTSQLDTKVLPQDKSAKLVFYCANTQCMASHEAAKAAAKAGYKDVNVMSDGILGWKKAGKPTEAFKKAT